MSKNDDRVSNSLQKDTDDNIFMTSNVLKVNIRYYCKAVIKSLCSSIEGVFASTVMIVWIVFAIISIFWTPYNLLDTRGAGVWSAPSWQHWLGTDGVGADILSWLMAGSAVNLLVVMLTAILTAIWGGLLCSIFLLQKDSYIDAATVVIDTFIAIPTVLLALLVSVPIGPTMAGLVGICGFGYGLNLARIVKPTILHITHSKYVEIARLQHVTRWRMFIKHVLPNIVPVCSVQLSLSAATSVLAEVALTYLGMGLPDDMPSWGRALATSSKMIAVAPMSVLWSGLVITVVVVAIHCFGDAFGSAVDPLRNRLLRLGDE